ncbi:LTA synthase family protein [Lapidilactobacillus gannanensis]|uniref:LTA synthase family protein n=1 Tax=Lapidilactobacillus gannanensis TaxID=2486002 RepID=A0ABW4BPM5_9LACO|nr:LTA synthase family protein [Lapidilactobacillus gannanensis]
MIYISFFIAYVSLVLPLIFAFIKKDVKKVNYLLRCLANLIFVLSGIILIFKYFFKLPIFGNTQSPFDFPFTMKFIFALMVAEIIIICAEHFLRISRIFEIESIQLSSKKAYVRTSLYTFLVFVAILVFLSSKWTTGFFGQLYPKGLLYPEQIIYNLTQPMEGTDQGFFVAFLSGPLLKSIMSIFISFPILLILLNSKFTIFKTGKVFSRVFVSLVVLTSVSLIAFAANNIDAIGFIKYFTSSSDFIEKNYVSPTTTKITFPKKKRNLIYIYVESLEASSLDKMTGGQMQTNLLPKLTQLSKDGINFSDTNKSLGGAHQFSGTGWTIAGMVAQSSGLPLKVQAAENNYGLNSNNKFLPGATTLTDILAKEGYQQKLLVGSDATFGGRRSFYTQHGNVNIDDLLTAKQLNRIPSDYHVWWGYEDSKLFKYGKDDLNSFAASDKPFNLTMLTANTHFPDGYPEKNMPQKYSSQYSNVINYTDTQVTDFVRWIQKQPFYDNTTIIIQGDHLSMDEEYFTSQNVPINDRRTFNLILNPQVDTHNIKTKNRTFGTFDMFPTTLAALGAKIDGDKLGIGTNLFSDKKTLAEKYGFQKVNDQLSLKSKFYDLKINSEKK